MAKIHDDRDLTHEGTIVIEDANGIIMQRTALIVRGERREHKPTTIEIRPHSVVSIER